MMHGRWLLIALGVGLVGCAERKADAYAACHKEHIAYYQGPRPQGSPPDAALVRMVEVCMMSHGYRLAASDGVCRSPGTLTPGCFTAATPAAWLRILF
jgi:hypothetical protein